MDLQLQDKVFIVTGGGAGIGGAISLTLAEEGAIPVIFGRSALKEDFQAALSERTSDFAFYQVDVTNEAAVASAIAATAERLLWGSDRPVSKLTHSYAYLLGHADALTQAWTSREREALCGGTASHIYQLNPHHNTQRTGNGFAIAR